MLCTSTSFIVLLSHGLRLNSQKPSNRPDATLHRSRAADPRPPHPVGAQRELVIEINIRVLMPLVARETGGDQALPQVRRRRHVDRLVVQPRATTQFGRGDQLQRPCHFLGGFAGGLKTHGGPIGD